MMAVRNESPASTPGAATPPTNPSSVNSSPLPPPNAAAATPEQAQLQEEYLRAMLRAGAPGQNPQNPGALRAGEQDPMMQMLSSMMSGMGGEGDPNNPNGLPFNPEELSQQFGLPSWATSMFLGPSKAPPTASELKTLRFWRLLHVIVALATGIYMLFMLNQSVEKFGNNPPAPATVRNPFTIFMMAQILLQSTRIVTAGPAGKRGPGLWYQMLKELAGDGAIVVFILGCASWWYGGL
jgi:hypothetical protein